MGEISTGSCVEIERIKQMLMDEFKICQRMIRSVAVEYQTLLKKTAVRLTNGLDSMYKEKFQHLDEIASKRASGEDVEDSFPNEFWSTLFATYELNTAQLRNDIETLNFSSKGRTASCIPMSTPSLEAGTEVQVDVASGITKQGVFWLHLPELPESSLFALADLHKQISMKLIRDKEWKSFRDLETTPGVGDYVLVDTSNGWTRGKIEKLKDDNMFAVRLVDYGDLISCGTDLLLPMKTDIYPDADYQALRCCLSLDGDPFDIPIEAVWAFNDLLQENFSVRNPVICIFKEMVVGKENEEIFQVDLMVKDKKQNSISISQALNKKIADKAKGRDSIACRDIRYSANECAVSRYIERPAEDKSSQKSTLVVIENAAEPVAPSPSDVQQDTESCGLPVEDFGDGLHELLLGQQLVTEMQEDVLTENPAPTVDGSMGAVGKNLVTESLHQASSPHQSGNEPKQLVMLEEQCVLPTSEPSVYPLDLQNLPHSAPSYSPAIVSSENLPYSAPSYSPATVPSENLPYSAPSDSPATVPSENLPYSAPSDSPAIVPSENLPYSAPSDSPAIVPSENLPYSAPSDSPAIVPSENLPYSAPSYSPATVPSENLPYSAPSYSPAVGSSEKLLYSAPSYSPTIASSENLTATLDKPSTLKADALPFVSRSQTNLNSLANRVVVSTDEPVRYQLENSCECTSQEESMRDMHPYFGPPMSLSVHYTNYAGAKPLEFGGIMPRVMPGTIYPNQESEYSFMPPIVDASCIPTYPCHREVMQGSYSHQETFDSDAPVSERNSAEPKQVGHLLPAVCSAKGAQFMGEVASQLDSDGMFWMQLSRNETWNRMQATLNTCNKLTLPVACEEVVPGLFVTVPSSKATELYRAEVLSVKDRKAILRCIDYGKTIVAPKDSLKPLVDKVRSLPKQAVLCRLYSSDGEQYLDQYMRKLFDNLVKGKMMTATVMSIEPGNSEILVVKLLDNTGRDVLHEVLQSHFIQRLRSQDDSGLSVMQPSRDLFCALASLSDTAAQSSPPPVFPLKLSQQNPILCEPVKELMASVCRAPASLSDVAHASLSLGSLPYDLRVPPPSLLPASAFSQMGDAKTRMMLAQNISDAQNEWNNQQVKVENQTNHHQETSGEMPKDRSGRSRRGTWQPRFRDDERRSTPPPNAQSDGYGSGQQVVDDDRAGRKGCFICGDKGHIRNYCPRRPPPSKKGQNHGGYGRTNSRK